MIIEKQKEIKVNGITLRLKRLDAFEQFHLLNTFIPAIAGVARALVDTNSQKGEAVANALESFVSKIPVAQRDDILFNHLLSKRAVVIVVNGMELDLVASANGARTIMNDDLSDISDLLMIAGEVVRFNFSRFFDFGKKFTSQQ